MLQVEHSFSRLHKENSSALLFTGVCESVWAIAMRDIPTGTPYAVWAGIGASLTVLYSMLTGDEPISPARILLIVDLVICVVGLRIVN